MIRVYSMLFECENPTPGASTQIVAPVDADGLGQHVWPRDRRKTLLDVEAGDEVLIRDSVYHVVEVRVYRSAMCDNAQTVVPCGRDYSS